MKTKVGLSALLAAGMLLGAMATAQAQDPIFYLNGATFATSPGTPGTPGPVQSAGQWY